MTSPSTPRDVGLDSTCWIDGVSLSRPFSEALPAKAADLLDLALAVYAADRASPRYFNAQIRGSAAFMFALS